MNKVYGIATREKMIEEACTRLELLNLDKKVLNSFKENQTLYYSERQSLKINELFADNMFDYIGTLYHVQNNNEFVEIINDFEKEHGGLVYHAIYDKLERYLHLFYVTQYKDEWWYNREEINDNCSFVYSVNLDNDSCSHFRIIYFKVCGGGLIRTSSLSAK